MTREEQTDWVCRLKADLNNGVIFTPWNKEFTEALTDILEQQFCEDAISRQVVIDGLASIAKTKAKSDAQRALMGRAIFFVEQLPPVTTQPKTGHWIEENINGGRKVFCSECGCPPPFEYVSTGDVYSASGYGVINKTKFCPNCGAKMESEDV